MNPLSEYWPKEIADAIQYLIDSAVRCEREACANVAEAAREPAGALGRGDRIETNAARRAVCLEIGDLIRERR